MSFKTIDRVLRLAFVLCLGACTIVACGEDDPKNPGEKNGGDTAAAASKSAAEFEKAEAVTDTNVKFDLLLSPKVGETYVYRITQNSRTTIRGRKMVDNTVFNFTMRVTDVNDDGSISMEMRYDSIRYSRTVPKSPTDSALRTITYDTRQKADTAIPGSIQNKLLIGKKVQLTLSKLGELREVSNVEPIVSGMLSALGAAADSVSPKQREMLRQQIKVQGYGSVLQQLFLQTMPDDTVVTVGETWSRRDSVPMLGIPSQSMIVYKLADVRKINDRPVGNIVVDMKTTFPQKKLEDEAIALTVDEASTTGGGSALYDLESGFPVRKQAKIDVAMKVTGTAKVGPDKGKTDSASQNLHTDSLVELVRFEPAK